MQADIFYRYGHEKSIPFSFMTAPEFSANVDDLSIFERNSLLTQQFVGNVGDVGLICNTEGLLVKVYIGCEAEKEPLAIAIAVNKLPVGSYVPPQTMSQNAICAWSLAQYRFDLYKKNSKEPRVLVLREQEVSAVLAEVSAVFIVRDLINRSADDLDPKALGAVVAQLAKEHNAEYREWVGDELLRDNFPAIHAVGRAAAVPPRLLSLVWGDAAHPRVTLVGKGVCFDSGGLDLKPSNNMRLMKKDMGGAAHVVGLAQWIMKCQLPIRLQVLIPAVENAVGSCAYRPGDILTMRNGLKVEIDNTDAEGRLVLADALVKACEDKPDLLINFATLTGAARVAVGTEIAAMFTNDDNLAAAIMDASREAADPVWRMPLFSGYMSMLDSSIADLANSNPSSYAGAIIAALFLQRFIDDALPWLHFDVMAWNVSNKPGKPEGGEAMALRAVGQYLLRKFG